MYIPGRVEIIEREIRECIEELQRPVMVMGDFNAHHENWGNRKTDARGRVILEMAAKLGTIIINEEQQTGTAIDLTIVSPELTPGLQWEVIENPFSSDHFAIITTIGTDGSVEPEVRNYKKAR